MLSCGNCKIKLPEFKIQAHVALCKEKSKIPTWNDAKPQPPTSAPPLRRPVVQRKVSLGSVSTEEQEHISKAAESQTFEPMRAVEVESKVSTVANRVKPVSRINQTSKTSIELTHKTASTINDVREALEASVNQNGSDAEILDLSGQLEKCTICDRKFVADRLARHRVACKKASAERKVFDVQKARVQGTDMEKYLTKVKKEGDKVSIFKSEEPKKEWELETKAFGICRNGPKRKEEGFN